MTSPQDPFVRNGHYPTPFVSSEVETPVAARSVSTSLDTNGN
ncbi:hypothetical protein [Novosphingobium sp.]